MKALRFSERPFLLFFLVAFAFFFQLGNAPLFDLDEGAFSSATWEMLQRGDFITPYSNGTPRFDKPILIYWLQAASVSIFGINEWGFRLPSALMGSVWVFATYLFARQQLGYSAACRAAAMMACSLGVLAISRAATADALLNALIALTMLDIYRYSEKPLRTVLYRVFLWMGLGVLAKGPIAILIPLIVSFIFFLSNRRLRSWLLCLFNPIGWLIFLAIVLPWYMLILYDQGWAFIEGFFLKHNLSRFSSTMEGHGGNLLFYLPVVFLIVLPFSGVLITLISTGRTLWNNSFNRFLVIWFGFVFVFFSFSSTQLPHYLLYGSTPLFLLMAPKCSSLRNRWLAYLPGILFLLLLVALPELLKMGQSHEDNAYRHELLTLGIHSVDLNYRILTGVTFVFATGLLLLPKHLIARGLITLGILQWVAITQGLLPLAGNMQQQPVKAAAAQAKSLNETVIMWGINMPSFTVYSEQITPRRFPESGELVFTRADKLKQLGAHSPLFTHGGIILTRKQ
ncbi:MAG: glycosyltransferase family 39 protein [Gammaproteobacteria bacterium]|nr:glycosyltransferase family 39 protein [Gammaproteobacteria bacterium]